MENLSLIDFSLEDDGLFSTGDQCLLDPPSPIRGAEHTLNLGEITGDLLSEETNSQEEARSNVTTLNEELPELSLSPESKKTKSNRNLRKSLAWDSAFFTCEGAFGKEDLAGIPEETRRSGESSTTFESDSWTVERFETKLFDNVRASVQKSLGGGPNKDLRGIKGKKEGLGASKLGPKEKVMTMKASQNKIRAPTATGITRTRLPPKQPEITSKSSINSKLPMGATNIESKSTSLKPPKILPKPSNIPKTLIKGPTPLNSLKRSSTGNVLNAPSVPKLNSTGNALNAPVSKPTKTLPSSKRTQAITDPKPVTKKKPVPTKTLSSARGKIGTPNKLLKHSTISPNSSIDSVKSIGSSPGSLAGRLSSQDPGPGCVGLSRTSSNSSVCSEDRGFKPSGLRLPTPKIGYFDKEKSVGRNMVEKENVDVNMSDVALRNLEEKISSLGLSQV